MVDTRFKLEKCRSCGVRVIFFWLSGKWLHAKEAQCSEPGPAGYVAVIKNERIKYVKCRNCDGMVAFFWHSHTWIHSQPSECLKPAPREEVAVVRNERS